MRRQPVRHYPIWNNNNRQKKTRREAVANGFAPCAGGRVDAHPLILVPDASGCLVFSLWPSQEQDALWGPTTKTVVVGEPNDPPILRVFVEFLPGGAWRLFSRPVTGITGFAHLNCGSPACCVRRFPLCD